jgi:hypothetical protein
MLNGTEMYVGVNVVFFGRNKGAFAQAIGTVGGEQ